MRSFENTINQRLVQYFQEYFLFFLSFIACYMFFGISVFGQNEVFEIFCILQCWSVNIDLFQYFWYFIEKNHKVHMLTENFFFKDLNKLAAFILEQLLLT